MAYELTIDDMDALLTGACLFGSGGGGTVASARKLLAHFREGDYYPHSRVRVLGVDEVTTGDAVMTAYLGAPAAITNADYPRGPVLAVQQIQARLAAQGRRLAYLVPPESGALGFVVTCLVAARLGLAVIDGDGAGRAVPSLPQLSFAANIDPRPAFLVSESGLSVELNVTPADGTHSQTAAIIDNMLRPIVAEARFGQFGGLAMWVMDPAQLRRALPVRGTLTRALALGRLLLGGQIRNAGELIRQLHVHFNLQARILFGPARFVAASLDTGNGFDRGSITLQAGTRHCRVLYQNESLLAWADDQAQPLAMAPDTLAYFIEDSGQYVCSNSELLSADGTLAPALSQGSVSLIGIAAHPALTQPGSALQASFHQLVASLGYHGPYLPLNEKENRA